MANDAARYVPAGADLHQLARAAQKCKGCELYKNATQAVLGEGPARARIVMVGEQPGDREDLTGKPFVGPAGALLNKALDAAGIPREDVYITNAVKHFKFEERGKRRIHKKPSISEIEACHPWLAAELACVQPELIVCLGTTAARAVTGRSYAILANRGKFFDDAEGRAVTATVHPSAILRSPDQTQRHKDYESFVKDLVQVRKKLEKNLPFAAFKPAARKSQAS